MVAQSFQIHEVSNRLLVVISNEGKVITSKVLTAPEFGENISYSEFETIRNRFYDQVLAEQRELEKQYPKDHVHESTAESVADFIWMFPEVLRRYR